MPGQITSTLMEHQPSNGPDGFPLPEQEPERRTLTILRTTANRPYEQAHEQLTNALITCAAMRCHVPVPTPGSMLATSYMTFLRIASMSVAMTDDAAVRRAKAEAIQDVCADLGFDLLDVEAQGVRAGIESFMGRLADLGRAVRR